MNLKNVLSVVYVLGLIGSTVFLTKNYLTPITLKVNTMSADTAQPTVAQDSEDENEEEKSELIDLKNEMVILLYGPIGEQTLAVAESIKKAARESKPIWLLIDSPGGSVTVGGQILTAVQSSGVDVNTVCLGMCASMAAIIHQHGTKRYMVDRSLLMFHEASGGVSGPIPQMLSRLTTMDRYVNKMIKYVAKRSGHKLSEFKAQLGPELWIDAEDAKKQGFTDAVVNVYFEEASAFNSGSVANRSNQGNLKHLFNIENYGN